MEVYRYMTYGTSYCIPQWLERYYERVYGQHQQQRNVRPVRLDALGAPGAPGTVTPYFAKSLYPTDAPTRPLVQAERSFPPPPKRNGPSHLLLGALCRFADFLNAPSFSHVYTILDLVSWLSQR